MIDSLQKAGIFIYIPKNIEESKQNITKLERIKKKRTNLGNTVWPKRTLQHVGERLFLTCLRFPLITTIFFLGVLCLSLPVLLVFFGTGQAKIDSPFSLEDNMYVCLSE